ncbi:ATP-binding protein [Streptomyces sp. NPDC047000]|uniref:ATP-binding protein n=1 Tax=Streptomyces sp. NPDC047000 TaxID=3155474 RepID=UPI0033E0C1EB
MLTETPTSNEGPRRTPEVTALKAQFMSTPRGARLARQAAVRQMGTWGHPPESDASCTVALVVGELAANAVRHGRAPGHDFGLHLTYDDGSHLVRVEVADANAAKHPPAAAPTAHAAGESGRGLLLVATLAARWGWTPRDPLGKTVWAEVQMSRTPA